MKKYLIGFLLFSALNYCYGQINLNGYSTTYSGDRSSTTPLFVVAMPSYGFYMDRYAAANNFENLIKENPAYALMKNDSYETPVFFTTDSSEVYFFINGIYKNNASTYEYRILENKEKVIQSWQSISQFAHDTLEIQDFKKGMAYLGGYKTTLGNFLFIELRKKGMAVSVTTLCIFWAQTKPPLLAIYTSKDFNTFLNRVNKIYGYEGSDKEENKEKWAKLYPANEIDTSTYLPKKFIAEAKEENIIFFLGMDVNQDTALEYRLYKDKKLVHDWQPNQHNSNFIWLKDLKNGDYTLQMRLAIQRHNVTEYAFIIKPEWYQTKKMQFLWGVLLGVFILLFNYFLKQKKKLNIAKKEKQGIDNELKAIRSQLNPHFVFNALSSIQGLMNNNKLSSANYYLTAFSTLLRDSLQNGNKEFVPLSIEIKTLETYIKLENLRFPFNFSLDVDKNLDINAIEIPYLLLQPLVENAIKHGISNLHERGVLKLRFYAASKNLKVAIQDNGRGFNTEGGVLKGYGLKLTKERIRLLNQSNPDQTVNMSIYSDVVHGTSVHLTFENWL